MQRQRAGLKKMGVNGWFNQLKQELDRRNFATRKVSQKGKISDEDIGQFARKFGVTVEHVGEDLVAGVKHDVYRFAKSVRPAKENAA